MDYDFAQQQQQQQQQPSPQAQHRTHWPPQLLTGSQQSPFPSPVSPSPYYYTPSQQSPQSESRPTSSNLTLNLSSLSVTSPTSLSPINPSFHSHHPHGHAHHHSQSSGTLSVSPITPVSPPNFTSSHLSPQPSFQFNFDSSDTPSTDSSLLLAQRRPSTGSHSTSSSELGVEKSIPRKRSLTNTASAPPPSAHHAHSHSNSYSGHAHAHVHPHPIITTTASSPPSLSELSSQGPLTPASSQPPTQIDINAHHSPYDDPDGVAGYSLADQGESDDESGKPNAVTVPTVGVIGKPMGTNNFVTKLYQMINDPKSQHFIAWTDLGTSFVVSNVGEFSRSILGSHFKHNNFSSFVRQLNMYGFHKINRTPRAQRTSTTSQTWEFSHPKFLRARPDLLDAIKRKALEPDPRERGRVELPGEVARLLTDMRDENKALWHEISRLGGRVPVHIANTFSASSSLSSLGTSSTAVPKLHIGGDDEDDDVSDEGFSFNLVGPSFGGGIGGGGPPDAWMSWVANEMRRERRKVEKLSGIVRALCDTIGTVSPTLMQELNALNAPSPSPSPVPHSPVQSDHSPNIYITSPPSPSTSSHGHPSAPMLSIPQYPLHTPGSSPTTSEFAPFGRHGRQPSITLTPDADSEGPGREKRQRTAEEEGEGEMSLDVDMDVGGEKKCQQQQRARSDSAPTWANGPGLTANWGRPRSGSGYGR